MNRYRLYVWFSDPETHKERDDHVVFDTYEEAVRAAEQLEKEIAEGPTSRRIVSISGTGQRLSFQASGFKRTKILAENEDPNVPSFDTY